MAQLATRMTASGNFQLSFINAGEWLNYTVNVPSTGNYTFDFRMASLYGATFHVEVDGVNKSGPITLIRPMLH